MTFTATDRSASAAAVKELETIYGFCPIEAAASQNFLSITAFEELVVTRKLCGFMQL